MYKIKLSLLVFASFLFMCLHVSAQEKPHTGVVVETQDLGNYTYMKLDVNGKDVWLAAEPLEVSVGDKIEYRGGTHMKNFFSKSLDKTFESIIFITHIRNLRTHPEGFKEQDQGENYHDVPPPAKKSASIPKKGEITKAENGKDIKEIYFEREQLKDKQVVLRARVMKINSNILGKNWITLRDGTGLSPDDKIIALTSDNPNIGDIVTVKGVIKNDVDLGRGYQYKVIIGDASLAK